MRTTNAWWMATAAGLALVSGAAAAPVDETISCDKDGTVRVSNVAGSVRIETHDAAEVRVTGTIDEDVEDVRLESRAGDVSIEVILPRRSRGDGEADLVIRVPVSAEVEVETVSATIDAAGTRGQLDFDSVSGDVKVRDAKGEVGVSTVSGAIDLAGIDGELDVESVSGTVTIRPTGAPVSVETTSGNIRIEEGALSTVSCTSVSGEIELRAASGRGAKGVEIELENFSGGILLEVPESLGAEVSVETFSGRIETDFGGRVHREEMGPGASLEESWGDGAARISLSTFSGEVELRKAGARKAEKE